MNQLLHGKLVTTLSMRDSIILLFRTSTESSSSSATDGTGSFKQLKQELRVPVEAPLTGIFNINICSAEWGVDYESYEANGGVDVSSEAEWQVEYGRSYNSAYAMHLLHLIDTAIAL